MSELHAKKESAALASIGASAAITLGKLVAGLMSGSLALMSEAGHAAVDTGATILTWLAVRAANKPADDEHHYGHGKYESLAALVETGLLFALTAFVVIEATHRLLASNTSVEPKAIAFIVLVASIVIDAVRWVSLSRIAKETRSDALAADALHFSSDLVASVLVLIGLTLTYFGYPQADSYAAFGVAAFVAIAGYRLGRRTVDALLDTAPEGVADRLREAVEAVPGVVRVDFLRLRPAGPVLLGEIGIGVARTLPQERVARISDEVADAVRRETPEAELTLTTTPVALDEETALERVLLVAARQRRAVHHVTIQEVDGRRSISLDLELDGRLPHGAAHEAATRLEAAMREELGGDVEVETHIEPLETRELEGHDVSADLSSTILEELTKHAETVGLVSEVHNVRVRRTDAGLVVNYHCRVDPMLSVTRVHDAVDSLDRRLKAARGDICRVVGHAEPKRDA
ncbi:MAG: cation diffusion facilitator family transporter [Hyphomicrobiales bacterium]|nr:cation diffusion facilitator family transporter [Rhodoblastus sp.]MCC0000199.1 cation diffusion facilitator family transporter [Methylobacteriaceae bacterium]MCC2104660.1 cation diffusion facilitator family transporter [Hyphomicrobiales bacterium]HRY04158.1 cation diffusion facilitator family transporter [Beijerinckiaceae bacterium]MCB1525452.1 cation diffusion facilitator family transporter [Rhodoblastus sp.]